MNTSGILLLLLLLRLLSARFLNGLSRVRVRVRVGVRRGNSFQWVLRRPLPTCRPAGFQACVFFLFIACVAVPLSRSAETPEIPKEDAISILRKVMAGTNQPTSTNVTSEAASQLPADLQTDVLDDKVKLGTGDLLSFRIIEDKEDPLPLVVTDSGELAIPYIGRVKAVGKTCKQMANEIKAELEKDYYHTATVVLSLDKYNLSRGKVYLVGQVRAAGPQDIPSDEVFTLSKAIMRAGGFSEFADKKRVQVTRNGGPNEPMGKIMEVNVGVIIEEGRADQDVKLEPGDLIYIPSRLFKF